MSPSTVYPSAKRKTFTFTDARFKPYATAVGQASLAWNYLHEMLGALFSTVAVDAGLRGADRSRSGRTADFAAFSISLLKVSIKRLDEYQIANPSSLNLRRED